MGLRGEHGEGTSGGEWHDAPVSERRWSAAAVICAAVGAAVAAWAQRAEWHARGAQADVLAGHLDTTASPSSSLGVVVSAGICILVAVWVLPSRWRLAVGSLSIMASCAVMAVSVAFARSHDVPAKTLSAVIVAGLLIIVAGVGLWSGRAPAAGASVRAARYDRVSARHSEAAHGPQAVADPWKQLDQGIDPTEENSASSRE